MTVSLFSFVDLYSRQLATLDHLMTKGAEFAKAQGEPEEAFLDWRLIDDMAPFRFQAMVVCNFSRQWPARVVGLDLPAAIEPEIDLAGFRAAIADAKAYLAALTPQQFAGRDEVPLTVEIGNGMTPTLPSAQWLTVFATTNLYFHLSTAYGILRAKGVQIGKPDMFAGGL
ncbi:MAG TPA: DUF1993 domain-containing protein [Phenylobacterium sp.]|jgi:hypothetical protein|uniref:DUF1993 domain-containing protein n=1 Tax=Phenylobacterium sp. TaxID=1871053 RepID=UPI002D3C5114|nr:DUF1993 domain-containing protein [Phenylobacterium sp.]HZZ69434.1 DUF1993 domain-containing protein [Phenylobacterium sp.]